MAYVIKTLFGAWVLCLCCCSENSPLTQQDTDTNSETGAADSDTNADDDNATQRQSGTDAASNGDRDTGAFDTVNSNHETENDTAGVEEYSTDSYAESATDTYSDTDTETGTRFISDTQASSDSLTDTASETASADCESARIIQCGTTVEGSTETPSIARWTGYDCSAMWMSGPESVYAFLPDRNMEIEVHLTQQTDSLSLFLLAECDTASSVTNALKCVAVPPEYLDDVILGFSAQKDVPLYIVVDGYDGASGAYSLELQCSTD